MTWWAGSLDKAINAGQHQNGLFGIARIAPPLFEARGIAPIAYTAFALVLGVAIGMVVRRVVPAMAITLAVFVAVQILTPLFVREHLGPTEDRRDHGRERAGPRGITPKACRSGRCRI